MWFLGCEWVRPLTGGRPTTFYSIPDCRYKIPIFIFYKHLLRACGYRPGRFLPEPDFLTTTLTPIR